MSIIIKYVTMQSDGGAAGRAFRVLGDPDRVKAGAQRIVEEQCSVEAFAELIRRDLPFYEASISAEFVSGMNQFARDIGILKGKIPYDNVVATRFAGLWRQ